MDQPSTYTLTQKNEHGQPVNTITGLTQGRAEMLAALLATGDAYTSAQPWTVDVVRELSRAEQLANVAGAWMAMVDQLAAVAGLRTRMPASGQYCAGGHYGVEFVTIAPPPVQPVDEPASPDVFAEDLAAGEAAETVAPQPIEPDEAEAIARMVVPEDISLPDAIAPERVAEIVTELNRLTRDPDDGIDWWDWIEGVPEFDREATSNVSDTGVLVLVDGTVLRYVENTSWRATGPAEPVDEADATPVTFVDGLAHDGQPEASRCGGAA